MTLGVTVCEITVQGNGVTTTFTYPFPIPSTSDAILTLTDSTGAQTVVGPTQFVLTGIGSATGGTFTYPVSGSPIASGNFLTLERVLPIVQTTTVHNQGPTFSSIEAEFDYLTMIDQQLQQQVSRAYTANFIDINPTTQLPPAAQRANLVFGFDASGNPLMYSPTGAAATNALNVTYLPGGAGAIATNVQAKLREFPSVKDFGAKADGVTNDAAAFTAAAAAVSGFLVPSGTYLISSNVTIPNGVTMEFASGAVLNVSGGVTFTCHGLLNAPRNIQLFTGAGSVVGMRSVYPEWWGAQPNNSSFDSQPAMQAAHTAVKASNTSDGERPTIYLGAGVYYVGSQWVLQPTASNQIAVLGDGTIFGGTRIQTLSSFPATSVVYVAGNSDSIQQIADWCLKDFAIIGGMGSAIIGLQVGTSSDSVTRLIGVEMSKVENIFVSTFPIGIQCCHVRLVEFDRCSVWNNDVIGANTCISIIEEGWFTGDMTWNDCQFVNTIASGHNGIFISSSTPGSTGIFSHLAGIRWNGLVGYNCDTYVTISVNNGSMVSDIFLSSGCQFDGGAASNGILLQSVGTGTYIRDINFDGVYLAGGINQITALAASGGNILETRITDCFLWQGTGSAIVLSGVNGATVTGNRVADNNNTTGPAIVVENGSVGVNVANNIATTVAAGAFQFFVQVGAGCAKYTVLGNNSNGLATVSPVSDAGSAPNAVANNI